MTIHYLERVDSTHTYLKSALQNGTLTPPVLVYTNNQTAGVGSRGNSWTGYKGNLFFSFAFDKTVLPSDLPVSSLSIYLSMVLKDILIEYDEDIFIKWPNDIYKGDKKAGGIITTVHQTTYLCGVGLNTKTAPENKAVLNTLDDVKFLQKFTNHLQTYPSWKKVLNNFRVEFEKSRRFLTHTDNQTVSMHDATLCEDGSLLIDGQRIFSLR